MIKVNLQDNLIGDFLGCIPAVQELARTSTVCCTYGQGVSELFKLTGLHTYVPCYAIDKEYTIGCQDGWKVAIPNQFHMTQAYYQLLGLPIPDRAVRAQLNFEQHAPGEDVILLSPFANSLPDNQRLPQSEWQRITELCPSKKFVVLGAEGSPKDYIIGSNVSNAYGRSFREVCKMIAANTLISVVTGTSHISFHTGGRNILLTNQVDNWGNNHDAIQIKDDIPTLKAERIIEYL